MTSPARAPARLGPMLRSIHISNIRRLADVSIDLEPFTLIVGPNGCGKSTLLDVIHYFSQLATNVDGEASHVFGRPGALFTGPRDRTRLLTSGRTGVDGIKVEVAIGPDQALSFKANWGLGALGFPRDETMSMQAPGARADWPNAAETARTVYEGFAETGIGSCVRARLDARRLAAPSYVATDHPRVEYDGSNIASVLAMIRGRDPALLDHIVQRTRTVVPDVSGIRFDRAEIVRSEVETIVIGDQAVPRTVKRSYWGDSFDLKFDPLGFVPADAGSEGTLIALALVTMLHYEQRPTLVLLDDIERGLHPRGQMALVRAIRDLQKNETSAPFQVIATTHSPYVLDAAEHKNVRVMAVGDDGLAECAPLVKHPQYEKWKDQFAPGELWSLRAEDWVFSGTGRAVAGS